MKCRAIDWIAIILVIIGAINWGLIGFFNYNLVLAIFGEVISRIIFAIVGLCGLWMIYFASRCRGVHKPVGPM
jgi:uncharacterized membrane protein YuzA (DUF378 family)